MDLLEYNPESPVKLKRLYDTAAKIIDAEMRELKLEDLTQDLIALEHPQVPVAGFEVGCSPKEWKISEVKEKLQGLLRVNIRELRLKGTEFVEFPEELPYYANHYIWNLGDDFAKPDVQVLFSYEDNYPFAFDVRPRSGSTLKSGSLGGGGNPLLSFFCAQTWKFVYDVSFPVLVTLRDETTGYLFKMAFTVHLKRNIPDRSDMQAPLPISVAETYSDAQFCSTRNIPLTITTSELVDNGFDTTYSEVLENVNLTYNCLQYRCVLGKTEYDFAGMGHIAALQINVPYCAGAVIRGQKTGYKDGWTMLVTKPGAQAAVELIPLFSFPAGKIQFVKHEFASSTAIGPAAALGKDETVILKLRSLKKDSATNQPLQEITYVQSPEASKEIIERQPLLFLGKADFAYDVEISLLDGESFIGGYRANWVIPWEDLASSEKLTFHLLSREKASEDDQFELFTTLTQNSLYLPKPELTKSTS